MLIRKAKPHESDIIAQYLLLAMGDIAFKFIGEHSTEKAARWLSGLITKSGNQYSFENCFVAEAENQVVAVALVYNGAHLQQLRQPVAQSLKLMFNKGFAIEDETEAGEYYIDCIAVNPAEQGKGLGTKLLQFLIQEYLYKSGKTLGLLVDKENPAAKKLYLKLGFRFVKDKMFAGKIMEHLQIAPSVKN